MPTLNYTGKDAYLEKEKEKMLVTTLRNEVHNKEINE